MQLSISQIKATRALASKKGREESGLFVVEGEKLVQEALDSSFEVVEVWRRDEIGEQAMARISQLDTPPPVLAVVRIPETAGTVGRDSAGFFCPRRPEGLLRECCAAADSARPQGGLYLALDSIRDPGNLGTIVRIADWFGVSGLVMSSDTVDIFSPKVVQATMGAIFRVPFTYTDDLAEYCRLLRADGGTVYGTFLDGEDIYSARLSTGEDGPVILVIGNEAHGISPEVRAECSAALRIPSFPGGVPTSESLNAAVATAVAVAEFRRRLHA